MNIRPTKLERDPIIYTDDLSLRLIMQLAQSSCGEVFVNPFDDDIIGFLYFDGHYLECLQNSLEKNDWFAVPTEDLEAITKLGRSILEYIEQHPSPDCEYFFLASN